MAVAHKPNALTDSTGGAVGTTLAANSFKQTQVMPVTLAGVANSAAYMLSIPFGFTLLSAGFRVGNPASTANKSATLTLSTTAGSLTGGVISLTTAACNTAGNLVAASAISGANATGSATNSVVATASTVTAFSEGDGWIELTLSNNDQAAVAASINAQLNKVIAEM